MIGQQEFDSRSFWVEKKRKLESVRQKDIERYGRAGEHEKKSEIGYTVALFIYELVEREAREKFG